MHKSRSQFLFISLCGRKRTAALESQYMISFSTRIDCRMRSLKTLGKSAHHFSVTPLSWVLKGEFSLILSICESTSLCSQSLSKLFTPSVSKQAHIHLDGHPHQCENDEGGSVAPGNHNSCHWGSAFSLGSGGWNSPGSATPWGNPAASDEKQPWSYPYLTLDELALLRPGITWVSQIPLRYTLRPSRNEEYSKQALFYPIETGEQKGFIL